MDEVGVIDVRIILTFLVTLFCVQFPNPALGAEAGVRATYNCKVVDEDGRYHNSVLSNEILGSNQKIGFHLATPSPSKPKWESAIFLSSEKGLSRFVLVNGAERWRLQLSEMPDQSLSFSLNAFSGVQNSNAGYIGSCRRTNGIRAVFFSETGPKDETFDDGVGRFIDMKGAVTAACSFVDSKLAQHKGYFNIIPNDEDSSREPMILSINGIKYAGHVSLQMVLKEGDHSMILGALTAKGRGMSLAGFSRFRDTAVGEPSFWIYFSLSNSKEVNVGHLSGVCVSKSPSAGVAR